jgi:2-keto-4-pentenoate hydratase/2-oxohepta-3-ene-1,7-dioic acid hydratase in catechol pathway
MRVIRFLSDDGKVYLGEEDGSVLDGEITGTLTPTGEKKAVAKILAPLLPTDIYCIGLNYRLHAEESGVDPDTIPHPVTFMKPVSAVVGPGDDIIIPSLDKGDQLDWECELAMVIGKPCKDVKAANALDYVAGYTVANDVSARFWQMNAGGDQWIIGKGFDSLCREYTIRRLDSALGALHRRPYCKHCARTFLLVCSSGSDLRHK